jgi:hypothetical protein
MRFPVQVSLVLQSSRYGVRGVSSGMNIVNKCEINVKMQCETMRNTCGRTLFCTYCGGTHVFTVFLFFNICSHIVAERIFSHDFYMCFHILRRNTCVSHLFTLFFNFVIFHILWHNAFFHSFYFFCFFYILSYIAAERIFVTYLFTLFLHVFTL